MYYPSFFILKCVERDSVLETVCTNEDTEHKQPIDCDAQLPAHYFQQCKQDVNQVRLISVWFVMRVHRLNNTRIHGSCGPEHVNNWMPNIYDHLFIHWLHKPYLIHKFYFIICLVYCNSFTFVGLDANARD